jgi:anti-sigma regulatory factor (Ser/Thr protein kinase)
MPYWSETFDGQLQNVADVRRFTLKVLGDAPGADLVELVASELAGNAVLHSASGQPGGCFKLHVAAFPDHWLVRVDDDGGLKEPSLRSMGNEADESGRGLEIVALLASRWGVSGDRQGRAVWAEILIPETTERDFSGCEHVNGD